MDVATVLKETEGLPVDEQLRLLHGVWKRLIDSGWMPDIDDDLKSELDRRLDDLDKNPQNVLTWEQVQRRLRYRQ